MLYSLDEILNRAQIYTETYAIKIQQKLGQGQQGIVYATSRPSAIKIFAESRSYGREKLVYQRLEQFAVQQIRDFKVPQLLGYDDKLMVIEMTFVHPPFVLDFGGAYLDIPPEHLLLQDRSIWENQKSEEFAENWEIVKLILSEFELSWGIFICDLNTGNIQF